MKSPLMYEEFLEILKNVSAIRVARWNIMNGELLYHILDIYDDEAVAVKYYGKHKQWWRYAFYNVWQLKRWYEKGWIELRK